MNDLNQVFLNLRYNMLFCHLAAPWNNVIDMPRIISACEAIMTDLFWDCGSSNKPSSLPKFRVLSKKFKFTLHNLFKK